MHGKTRLYAKTTQNDFLKDRTLANNGKKQILIIAFSRLKTANLEYRFLVSHAQ